MTPIRSALKTDLRRSKGLSQTYSRITARSVPTYLIESTGELWNQRRYREPVSFC
jgi:hypothetical protein